MERAERRASVIRDYKIEARKRLGVDRCESCHWQPPQALGWGDMLHGHHVVPIAHGGADHRLNLALLCPTCHALAHKVWNTLVSLRCGGDGFDRELLLSHLRSIRDDPAGWLCWRNQRTAG